MVSVAPQAHRAHQYFCRWPRARPSRACRAAVGDRVVDWMRSATRSSLHLDHASALTEARRGGIRCCHRVASRIRGREDEAARADTLTARTWPLEPERGVVSALVAYRRQPAHLPHGITTACACPTPGLFVAVVKGSSRWCRRPCPGSPRHGATATVGRARGSLGRRPAWPGRHRLRPLAAMATDASRLPPRATLFPCSRALECAGPLPQATSARRIRRCPLAGRKDSDHSNTRHDHLLP